MVSRLTHWFVYTFRLLGDSSPGASFKKKNLELEARVNDRTLRLRGLIRELQEKQDEIATTNEELTSTLEDLVEQKTK